MNFLVPGGRSTAGVIGRFVLLAILWLTPVSAGSAQTLRGVALVIGNSTYEHLPALANPANDARAVESLLDELGFETSLSSDRDARRLSRDLRDFVEDAEGADVAILYYAGHGIEAGGENFLVPVDADLSALDAAGETLVPISAFIAELQATVPVAIVMLDACRDNPFPAGSRVRLDTSGDPLPVGVSGLGETRGATRLAEREPGVESYGTVIAFAAEPGRAALDGEQGGNSPYAEAVLRHFDAMAGEEFGTVMRMVAEEVYLKTSGRQRPWINESLRRLLYLGTAPAPLSGEEGELLAERRQLLVTIAGLPDPTLRRGQVERIASERGVPLDAVYGMLRALGADAPDDPTGLEKVLRAEAERFAAILAERETLASPDPEIIRLSALADRAEQEGLLEAADTFRERAKARYLEVETTLESQEAALRQRFIEGATVFARSAETKALAFDHLAAAHDYAEAFRRVDGRDRQLAWSYRLAEADALADHGNYKGDNAALERAIEAGRHALRIAQDLDDRESRSKTHHGLGNTLQTLGARESGTERLEEAIVAYHAALEERTRERVPLDWARTYHGLGTALHVLGMRESGTERLEQSAAAFRAALEEWTRERAPLDWAATQNNLGNTLQALGDRETDTGSLKAAAAAYRAALRVLTRERAPLSWAASQNNLGTVLSALGTRDRGTARLKDAVTAYQAALEERTRERVPLDWAMTQTNLGNTLWTLGMRENSPALLEGAVAAHRAALQEHTRERAPLDWAAAQNNLGNALSALGMRDDGPAWLEEAVAAYRAALQEHTRERIPLEWAKTQNNLGTVLQTLGERENGTTRLEEAVAAYRAALLEMTRERAPLQWAAIQNNFGGALLELGKRSASRIRIEEGRQAVANAWEVYREAGYGRFGDYFRRRIADADAALAALE